MEPTGERHLPRGIKLFSETQGDRVDDTGFEAHEVPIPGLGTAELVGDRARVHVYFPETTALFLGSTLKKGLAEKMVSTDPEIAKAGVFDVWLYSAAPLPPVICRMYFGKTTLESSMKPLEIPFSDDPQKAYYVTTDKWQLPETGEQFDFFFGSLDERFLTQLEFSFHADLTDVALLQKP